MCGIVGYVGQAEAAPILLDGLRRLEYRGYDSAGVAIVNGKQIETRKCAGRIANLAKLMTEKPPLGSYGISHTRWATHGKVTDENAHPHFDQSGKIALVHNGVIENYAALREQLERESGHTFASDTDTEVLAHLIGSIYEKIDGADSKARLVNATRAALKQVIGTYGIALVHSDIKDFMIGARRGSPLVLGVGKEENFLASDVSAIVAYTRDAVYLNDLISSQSGATNLKSVRSRANPATTKSARSSSARKTSARAISRITCSRKSLSSRTRSAMPCAGGSTPKNAPLSSVG